MADIPESTATSRCESNGRRGTADHADRVVDIFTDGACSPNPGPGGWGAILQYGHHRKEIYGADPATTNNRMEIMAAIQGLESLTRPSAVHVHTDSEYLRKGITEWLSAWKHNGWKTKEKKPVKNTDLWMRLDSAARNHTVQWFWVKGHAGHPENERADELACRGSEEAAGQVVDDVGARSQPDPRKPPQPAPGRAGGLQLNGAAALPRQSPSGAAVPGGISLPGIGCLDEEPGSS